MSTHYLPQPLPIRFGANAQAVLSVNPGGGAIVFVHGFNGGAASTWVHFPGLLPGRAACGRADMFFLSYDSLKTPATVSASMLRDRLSEIWADPCGVCNPLLDSAAWRSAGFKYSGLTLVAHSLGSIVARQAMVYGMSAARVDDWASNVKLVLFAPAHCGAKVQALAMECLSGFSWLGALMKYRVQTLNDLEPGSQTLQILGQKVAEIDGRGFSQIHARAVVWGERDTVVNQHDFGKDPPAEVIRGKGHVDVCKPSGSYMRPVEILEAAL